MLFCYNEYIITVWEKYLFNNQDPQGYTPNHILPSGVDIKKQAYSLLMGTSLLIYVNWEVYNNCVAKQHNIYLKESIYFDVPSL